MSPLTEENIQRKQLAVDELLRSFEGLNFGLNTDATEESLNRVRATIMDAADALSGLRENAYDKARRLNVSVNQIVNATAD